MTQAVYIIGGAGVGKSTFTAALLERLPAVLWELEDLHAKPNAAGNMVTLRGQQLRKMGEPWGLYLGLMREQFPGTDGLDRASSLPGEEWCHGGGVNQFQAVLGEGSTLATRRFLTALNLATDLLIIHLECDPMVHDLRLYNRGSGQDESFVKSTVTRAANLARDMSKELATIMRVDADHDWNWTYALEAAESHLTA
jgi:hypothetical protein